MGLLQDQNFLNSKHGQDIKLNTEGKRAHGSVPFYWLEGVFANCGVVLTRKKERPHFVTVFEAKREASGFSQRTFIDVTMHGHKKLSPHVPLDNARKALQKLDLL